MKLPNVNLSEKGGIPNGIRNLMQAILFISGGACADAGYWWWALAFTAVATALFGVNVVHYFSDNYLGGYKDGHKEGSRARGLISPEDDLLEAAYRVLASTPFDGGWLVVVQDIYLDGREPRVVKMAENPPPLFRKERHWDLRDADLQDFIHVNVPIQEPA